MMSLNKKKLKESKAVLKYSLIEGLQKDEIES